MFRILFSWFVELILRVVQHAHLPSAAGFLPQNRPCTPKIVGTFYMQGYKVKEKTATVPHCTPSFKTQWAPCGGYTGLTKCPP
jgi:hypothetical protein